MAGLVLSLATPVQSADRTTITLTDSTGLYNAGTNPGGWGTPNTALADVNAAATTVLTITVNISTPDTPLGTTYTVINAYTFLGHIPILGQTYAINPATMFSGGIALGLSTDPMPDGFYQVTYSVNHRLVGGADTTYPPDPVIYTLNQYFFVDGNVRYAVYDELRKVPDIYDNLSHFKDNYGQVQILNALNKYAILQGMLAYPAVANKTEMLNILSSLTDLTINYGANKYNTLL